MRYFHNLVRGAATFFRFVIIRLKTGDNGYEVIILKKYTMLMFTWGFILAVLISNIISFIGDGRRLDELRNSVLRLHILADSDSERDQELKLMVRDELLSRSGELFSGAESLEEAEALAVENLALIENIAEETLRKNGCNDSVRAVLTDMNFDERVYGDITMPAGEYRALRVEIGSAQGHNWWCVMYPPLCIPAACFVEDDKQTEEELFSDEERDIMYHPKKYRVRFAIWDKIKSILS